MEKSMKMHDSVAKKATHPQSRPIAVAAWHSLFWLVFANLIGVMLALLLLVPALNVQLGEWTYGRWIVVHMNLMLYGWTGIPLIGFLFTTYGADRGSAATWSRPILWAWSASLGVGTLSWLSGHSSGKLFLDWTGYARILFLIALLALWLLLLSTFLKNGCARISPQARAAQLIGLLILFAVPFVLYIATEPGIYPAVNPDTGGPTGTSQLESSLAIVVILLLLPFSIAARKRPRSRIVATCWLAVLAECALLASLSRGDISHHRPAQFLSLGSLLVWVPLMPAYYASFEWYAATRRWRSAFLFWWTALVVTGVIFFLPGVLDHFKFTDGLVGHSFVAMAGFTSSLLIFVMVQLLGEDGWIFNRTRSFYLWHASVIAYIVTVTIAGWREGFDPSFTIVPGLMRDVLYTLRLVTGVLMLLASLDWFIDASKLLGKSAPALRQAAQETAA